MEVDTNELLHRIGAVLRAISNKMDQLIEIVERAGGEVWFPYEEEAQTVADVLMDDACIPSGSVAAEPPKKWRILEPGEVVQEGDLINSKLNPPSDPPNGCWLAASSFYFGKEASFYFGVYFARAVADEPAKKWRILEPGEVVCSGDRVNAKTNPPSDPPNGSGWRPVYFGGTSVCEDDFCVFARAVADEPAKEAEPEHPAGPKPHPGEGYRILSKNPPEELQSWDDWWEHDEQRWRGLFPVDTTAQHSRTWYRRKIEVAEPPEPEYREPVLPGDFDRQCDFSSDGIEWQNGYLRGYVYSGWRDTKGVYWPCCRIKKDA